MTGFSEAEAARLAEIALAGVHREYPSKILHSLESDADVRPPRELTPVFFGCYDWHSAVHGHWALVRLLRLFPGADFASKVERALERSFSADKIAGELAYLGARKHFELPYGMAWLATLGQELSEWEDARAERWLDLLSPLIEHALGRLESYARALPRPVRSGEHSQSAFGLGLLVDVARATGKAELARQAEHRVTELYGADRDGPLHLEPSAYDFLSPCLAEADLVRRVLEPAAFAAWLGRFLPGLPTRDEPWLAPAECPDPSDGKLAHLDGLNLSRAWMLAGIAAGLPPSDPRLGALDSAAREHREAGLGAVTGLHYEGSHWLGTFAVYLCTRRGLPARDSMAP